jgi:hypothetical protein
LCSVLAQWPECWEPYSPESFLRYGCSILLAVSLFTTLFRRTISCGWCFPAWRCQSSDAYQTGSPIRQAKSLTSSRHGIKNETAVWIGPFRSVKRTAVVQSGGPEPWDANPNKIEFLSAEGSRVASRSAKKKCCWVSGWPVTRSEIRCFHADNSNMRLTLLVSS